MEEKVDEKISFWKRILISIKDFEKYKIFAIEKLSKSFKYFFEFALFFVLIIALSFCVKYGMIINKATNYIKNELPEFTYKEGKLEFADNKKIELQSNDDTKDISYKIIIDTQTANEEEINSYKEKIGLYNYGILFLKDKVIFRSSLLQGDVEKTYSDMQNSYGISKEFTKTELVNKITDNKMYMLYAQMFVVMYIYLYITYSISILTDALILALLGVITARIVRVKLKYSASYAMAIHALTLPIILNVAYIIINTYTGFYIKYFEVMYTTISYICMVAAILSIRSDLIKEKIVIGKIEEVQKNIRKENEENQKKDEKPEEKQEEPKEENKKEDKSEEEGKIELEDKDKNDEGNPATGES